MAFDRRPRAIALYSGGLDSTLAILVMMEHGVEVEAIKFLTHFGCDISDSSSCGSNPYPAAEQFGFRVKLNHLGWKFVDIVKNPRYGYGRNLNPCIDCRLLMLREAKDYMDMARADFVITGEVLGQRPKSQMRNSIDLVARQCGLQGRLVRPLSGRLLEPTIPEKEGLIKREWLLDISGRSRKRQMELAGKFGLEKYPSPAGGCLLTDPGYSKRARDLFANNDSPDFSDLNLLKLGRQFRLSDSCKLIVGRNQNENAAIASMTIGNDIILEVKGVGSPTALLRGRADDNMIRLAASITARYSDAKHQDRIEVDLSGKPGLGKIQVGPAGESILDKLRI